ncbi:hypothetical protein Vi05172_g2444 [Venturia inaequalis]|nr:hypothetical protein Vi05172_g2444 [Venturia inaequalis]
MRADVLEPVVNKGVWVAFSGTDCNGLAADFGFENGGHIVANSCRITKPGFGIIMGCCPYLVLVSYSTLYPRPSRNHSTSRMSDFYLGTFNMAAALVYMPLNAKHNRRRTVE